MAFDGKSRVAVFLTLFSILFTLSSLQCGAATRPLHGERLLKKHFPLIESLQRGPVPPSAASPCSHNPGGSGTCNLNEMNFVGRANRQPPPAFPSSVTSHVTIFFTLFTILLTLSTLQCVAAMRPLHGEQLLKKHFPLFESLQQGPVPPIKGSPCSTIPEELASAN
uniref:Transmembrane protein n=1 Tax=Salix viminalis TaxID=40686 RepID=A0A6N2MU22_SALVM